MGVSIRSCLTVGVATITAVTIAVVPSVKESAPVASHPSVVHVASPAVKLNADVQPLVTATDVPSLLVEWLQRIVVPPSASAPFPTPQFPPVVAGTSLGSSIKNIYNAVEPWVRYGFEVATYAVGWIPYVGWLSGQIMIFYNFGERIAHSITFNIADWLDRRISFVQGLINVGRDTFWSFVYLGVDEWNYFLPPLPPLPPFPFAAAAQDAVPADLSLAAALDPSTANVGEPEKSGNAFGATGEETAPDQLAKQTTVAEAAATVTEAEETTAPRIKIEKGADAEAATATSGASPKKADGSTNGSPKQKKVDKGDNPESAKAGTDSGTTAASTSPKTGKKDGTPKKDRTDNNDNK